MREREERIYIYTTNKHYTISGLMSGKVPRRDGSAIQRERLRQAHDILRGAGDVSLKRFLAICAYNIGLTERTALKYIDILSTLDLIEVDESMNLIRDISSGPETPEDPEDG